ncbi:MAG: MmgE/PrpD family protein [Methylobacteriaceae bacterium]|nr:MmgE/PrpD family protein [Methylobacteriaceae bacterium]
MTLVTPGIRSASELLAEPRPDWLERWSRFAADLTFADLPAEAVDRARLVLLDTIGAIAAGHREPETRALVAGLFAGQGAGPAPAIGTGVRLAPAMAALANGTAGTTLELDEGNQYARGHPAIHVLPAVLALGPRSGAGGRDLLVALCLSYEIGARIGIAAKLRVTMHPHGTWGAVGAALAVAKLGGADAATIRETVNVAANFGLSTSRRTMLEGATVRNAYAGVANQLGLLAVDLVGAGLRGERDGVGAVYGTVIAEDFRPDEMVLDLGNRWEIARNYFKRHAACRYTHGALDALGAIVAEHGPLDPDTVQAIEVDTYVWAAQLDGPEPETMLGAKFSLPFALATAIVHGGASVAAFRAPALADARARALARRVAVREDGALTALLPGLRPARLRVTLADGRVLAAETLTNRGDTEDPYRPDEVVAKFRELAEPVWGTAHVERLIESCLGIDRAADLAGLDALVSEPPLAGDSA